MRSFLNKSAASHDSSFAGRGWLAGLLSGEPHQYIGGKANPMIKRWWLIPHNKYINIYLHNFCRSDDDRALHDHPWSFISLMIKGRYNEVTDKGSLIRTAPSVAYRYANWAHRVELVGNSKPWTVIITGPKVKEWGFWCGLRWVHWTEFTREIPGSNQTAGCGEFN